MKILVSVVRFRPGPPRTKSENANLRGLAFSFPGFVVLVSGSASKFFRADETRSDASYANDGLTSTRQAVEGAATGGVGQFGEQSSHLTTVFFDTSVRLSVGRVLIKSGLLDRALPTTGLSWDDKVIQIISHLLEQGRGSLKGYLFTLASRLFALLASAQFNISGTILVVMINAGHIASQNVDSLRRCFNDQITPQPEGLPEIVHSLCSLEGTLCRRITQLDAGLDHHQTTLIKYRVRQEYSKQNAHFCWLAGMHAITYDECIAGIYEAL
ncbi:hypothetical protein [Massilia cavernae]|uniref:hypothetical protein n=1 Tax=Massilia cavernae TaxID=2320864 RepID=UPI0011C3BA00|nr:hypothetical protein [Massilia cavernae]